MHSRRSFISEVSGLLTLVFTAFGLLTGCRDKSKAGGRNDADEPANCDDLSGVSQEDMAIRKKLAYVNESPIADNQCANCNLFLPKETSDTCGGCLLFKGPVYKRGYCTYWAPLV